MASTTCFYIYMMIFNLVSLFTVVSYIKFSLTSHQRGLQYKMFISIVMKLNTRYQSDEGTFERTSGRRLKTRVLPKTVS
jgi:hypothetical protein